MVSADADAPEATRAAPPATRFALLGALALILGAALHPLADGAGWAPVLGSEPVARMLLLHEGVPRMLAMVLGGAGLAASGVLLQGLTRNPLASPGILGITAGAHVALVLVLATGAPVPSLLAAFVGALAAAGLTLAVAGPGGRQGTTLALAGIAVSLSLAAVAAAVAVFEEERMAAAFLWGAGEPLRVGWAPLGQTAPWLALGAAVAALLTRGLDLLALGESFAGALGLPRGQFALAAVAAAALTAGAAVALVGPIAFIGLVVPNALRRLGLSAHARLLPLAALWGAALLLGADVLAGALSVFGRAVPVGVITAVLGAPAFLWLIHRARGGGRLGATSAPATARPRPARAAVAAGLGTTLAAAMLLALCAGERWIAPGHVLTMLHGGAEGVDALVVATLRLPRMLVAAGCGALMGAAGLFLQRALRNPLAAPETLGLSQGAALAAIVAVIAGAAPGSWAVQTGALIGAALVLAVLAGRGAGGADGERIVLRGLALAALCAALAALTLVVAGLQASQALLWLNGSVYGRGWGDLVALAPVGVMVTALALVGGPRLDLLALGDAKAATLGVDPERWRRLALAGAALATAGAVSVAGSLVFVGLAGPHIARMLRPDRFRAHWLMSLVCGALLMVLADTAGRTLLAPRQVPAGIMTALIGAPYFIWLLTRHRQSAAPR
ncbi:MAG: iron chelate uptake ABC transporter family permease subunit [Halofilum sp. (in: g-proteobacteria)]